MMKQTKNRVLTVGGGSAGHVVPVLAVIDELAARSSNIEVRFWCDRSFITQARSLMAHATVEVKVEKIIAGKLRRYHGENFLKRATDLATLLRNLIDLFGICIGFFQSFIKLLFWRPTVIFFKGGFVCLPIGYAATLLRIPFVIHDSDTHPGLTNRLLARRATYIATGAPLEYYNYPLNKTRYVGIPVKPEFHPLSETEKNHAKELFHLSPSSPLLVVSGGSLGAKKINDALVTIAPELIKRLSIVHVCGVRQYEELKSKVPHADNYKLIAFLSDHLARLLGAADIVVSRAGASAMAELAAVKASVVLIPANQLADQQKNAKVFFEAKAAIVLDDNHLTNDPHLLLREIISLLDNPTKRKDLSDTLSLFAKPAAAKETADLIEKV